MCDDKLGIKRLSQGDEEIARLAINELLPIGKDDLQTSTTKHLHSFLSNTNNILILATHDDKPIGFLTAYIMPRLERTAHMAYFYEIEVSPNFRKKRIGTRMVNLLMIQLRNQGVSSCWVGTDIDNEAALSLYESTGAKREPELIHELWYENLT